MFKEIFTKVMAAELLELDFRVVGGNFYLYKRDIGIVELIGFDMLFGGRDFYIAAGASSFCRKITVYPNNQLSIKCYDVAEYSRKCGIEPIVNLIDGRTGNAKTKYGKKSFEAQLERNIQLFRVTLLRDLSGLTNLMDYYNFKVKADAFGHEARIPFPTIDTFFLCVQLEKIMEASTVLLLMLKRGDDAVKYLGKDISNALDDILENSISSTEICNMLSRVLYDHKDILHEKMERRISESRLVCDCYFKR